MAAAYGHIDDTDANGVGQSGGECSPKVVGGG